MLFAVPRRSIRGLLMGGVKYPSALNSVCSPPPFLRHRFLHLRTSIRCPPEVNSLFCCLKSSRFSSCVACPSTGAHAVEGDEVAKRVDYLTSKLEAFGIHSRECKPGQQVRQLCPKCKGGSSAESSLSFLISKDGDSAMWLCFRAKCGWKGYIPVYGDANTTYASKNKNFRVITERDLQLEPLCEELISYFSERNISEETLRRNSVMQSKDDNEIIITFCYKRKGVLVSCSYRTVSKNIWQELGTESIFYGLDDINQATDVIIVLSEIDKLSMEEAGYLNCVSVPCGVIDQICNGQLDLEDTKFQYLWNCNEYLEKASRIILATDSNSSGQAVAEELARRLGKERCWRVEWPKKNDAELCKDANEVLMYLGPDSLRKVVENAELYPIKGLFKFRDFVHEIDEYYYQSNIEHLGVSTGWRALDGLYNVVAGELTLITGVPNSGKSEWIDALLCNINERHGWKFALCSMENKVEEHARKLLEKHIKKPFFSARMTVEEFEAGKKWLDNTFYLIRCEDDCLPSVTWVLDRAKLAVLRYGVRGLVIDPYNELDHQRFNFQTETEYVSQMLTKVKRFAEHHSCHVWFVAHPKQLHDWDGRAPNLYDISGSAHFVNKCDNGIVIHRDRNLTTGLGVEVYVRKVRNKVSGTVGVASLSYKRVTGEFHDKDQNCSGTAVTSSEEKLERTPYQDIVNK
ncbi:twinkle homolog protein, chloroplastic/mitochondrial-like isoform X2 [Zingiber officinale]|uniref:twinkle homolog protein, chloroplastic/mitochondrial-like isoform X2 n=1 Tax=Zingiber officinale TaxID=94328 RepID=UPI001C4D0B9D|nr:twinkle homolog protein, chloroplastic/mitochondrial-like isoform X2 [Zingiber officinale]